MDAHTQTVTDYTRDPVAFIDDLMPLNEKRQPWRLSEYQRRVIRLAFRWNDAGRLILRLLLWGEIKKSGKTLILAALGIWWSYTRAFTEVISTANDRNQAQSKVFATMKALIEANPRLKESVNGKMSGSTINLTNGTVIRAIASDAEGEAGARHSLVIHDELHGAKHPAAQRLYAELTPPPTEPDAFRLIGTYAGYTGESVVLEKLYERGLTGERIDDELEVFSVEDGTFVMFWSGTPRQPWQTPEYYASQQIDLTDSEFDRMHRNAWTSGTSVFVNRAGWDACVVPDLRPMLSSSGMWIFGGIDASTKRDRAAAILVAPEKDGRVRLVSHRIWKPTKEDPLDIELTLEAWLREMAERHLLACVYADPYQLHRTITSMARQGIPIQEYPQSDPNLIRMSQNLFELFKGKNIALYDAEDLREHVTAAVALEKTRGFRIAKERTTKKIDGAVALAMACMAAVDHGFRGAPVGSAHIPWL
jgi:phage terminase large subunit-like protein